jgi:hypothetical protein
MSGDMTDILKGWEFDADNQIRIITAEDGRQVLQVRQPLGIEQYELDGRPDGKRPQDCESQLEWLEGRLESHVASHGGETGFQIGSEEFQLLQSESLLYYFRYLVLFQIGDFVRTARDTEHNMRVCSLVERFVAAEEDRKELLQYRPYIVRMNAISRAMISLHKELSGAAEEILRTAIHDIEELSDVGTSAFQFERERSLNYLKATLRQIKDKKPSPAEALKADLHRAVEEEDYEAAAILRDRIRNLDEEDDEEST